MNKLQAREPDPQECSCIQQQAFYQAIKGVWQPNWKLPLDRTWYGISYMDADELYLLMVAQLSQAEHYISLSLLLFFHTS